MTDKEKNLLANKLSEALKDQVIGFLGVDLLDTEDSEKFTDLASVAMESGFLLLANVMALIIMRLTVSGMPIEEAKQTVKKMFDAYGNDTLNMAAERVKLVEEMIQSLVIPKHRGH